MNLAEAANCARDALKTLLRAGVSDTPLAKAVRVLVEHAESTPPTTDKRKFQTSSFLWRDGEGHCVFAVQEIFESGRIVTSFRRHPDPKAPSMTYEQLWGVESHNGSR